MAQTRVCNFLQSTTCNHSRPEPLTFLHLPPSSRYRIYAYYAELPSHVLIHLKVSKGIPLFCLADQVEKLIAYATLRLVSRAVNADVPRCLASLYPVLLSGPRITDHTFLNVLSGKPWDLLGHVRSLTMVFNGFTHFSSVYCSSYSHGITTTTWESPSSRCEPTGIWTMRDVSAFIPTWKAIVARLRQSSHVAELELNLICDVEDSKAANTILDLLKPPLQISKCAIRLHPKPSPALEEIARQTVLRVTGHHHHQAAHQPPFRYLDLSTELRQRILEFSDLVTLHREVHWDAQDVYYLQDRYRRSVEPCSCGDFGKNSGAVFPNCLCFQSPFPLFLVCKTMLQDARTVFYTSNRIIILSPTSTSHTNSSDDLLKTTFGASLFFKTLNPASLSHLRDLEIILPGIDSYTKPDLSISQAIQKTWIPALQHAKKLSLTLFLGYEIQPNVQPHHTSNLDTSLRQLFHVHELVVRPLREVKGLDTFFVHAASPYDKF